jgi:hypothetical protein
MHGVNLSLAQLQSDFGEQLLRSFKHKLRLGQEEEAAQLRDKAVRAYLDAVETTGKLIDKPQDPDKISLPIRLRGAACQRLAYLVTRDAEKYYTLALQGYERAPLDFQEEITEVRKKRSWFYRDPYKKLAELKQIRREAPPGKDISDIIIDIMSLEQRIAHIEATALLAQGKPDRALESLREAFKAPTPELYAVRGRSYLALAQTENPDDNTVLAAKDLVRAYTDAEALITGAELYWSHEALRFEEDRVRRARAAWTRAEDLVDVSLAAMDKDDPGRARTEELRARIRQAFKEMGSLAEKYIVASKAAQEQGELESALSWVQDAVNLLGDSPVALRRQGQIQRALADRGGPDARKHAENARASFMAALQVEFLLTSQRVDIQLDLIRLWLEVLGDKAGARNWIDIAQRTLDHAEGGNVDELRKLYQPRLDELKSRARQ